MLTKNKSAILFSVYSSKGPQELRFNTEIFIEHLYDQYVMWCFQMSYDHKNKQLLHLQAERCINPSTFLVFWIEGCIINNFIYFYDYCMYARASLVSGQIIIQTFSREEACGRVKFEFCGVGRDVPLLSPLNELSDLLFDPI